MAKLSIAGPSFEGNAARKIPPRKIEVDEDQRDTIPMPEPAADEEEPITQRRPRQLTPAELEHELGIEKQQREIEEEEQAHVASLQDKIAGGRKARLEDAEADTRQRRAALANKWTAKDAKARAAQDEAEQVTLKKNRSAEAVQGTAFAEVFAATLEKNRVASLEECERLLPVGGDRIFSMISNRLNENMASGIQLAIEVQNDQLFAGQKYDLATEYVRIMAKYRKAVESKNKDIQQKTLEQLTRINRTLGIPLNAEFESHLEKEDLGYAKEQMEIDQRAFVANELEIAAKVKPTMPMSVEILEKQQLVRDPASLWHSIYNEEKLVPGNKSELVTEFILSLGRVNKASRAVNHAAYVKEYERFQNMRAALGLENDSSISSRIEPEPAEKYENPFRA